jgi:uncharacterized membrane protein
VDTHNRVLERNIEALLAARRRSEKRKGTQEKAADTITRFTGTMAFVYLHVAIIGGWIVVNLGAFGVKPFDPYPFGLLTMAGSLEAIFLSTFVLISQNRMMAASERRAELDLQVSLLSEHEVTQMITLLHAVARKVGALDGETPPALAESERDIDPVRVLEAIESRQERETQGRVREPREGS